jgi:hypothetical protein
MMLQCTAGPRVYYSLANFSQRIDLVQAAIQASLGNQRHVAIADALFEKIRRIWKKRNYLIHSRYVYVAYYRSGGYWLQTSITNRDATHPASRTEAPIKILVRLPDGSLHGHDREISERGFAYEKRGKNGMTELMMVNKGTFTSHAAKVAKRSRQLATFSNAAMRGRVPIVCSYNAVAATSKYKHP